MDSQPSHRQADLNSCNFIHNFILCSAVSVTDITDKFHFVTKVAISFRKGIDSKIRYKCHVHVKKKRM